MYAYEIFNHNWVLFYDANTRELQKQIRLQDAYWFPAIAVYPDVSAPTVTVADVHLPQGQCEVIDLLGAIYDDDNMAALAVSTASSANEQVARAWVAGTELHVEAIAYGRTTVTLTTDSNGKLATTSFVVTVSKVSIPGDVNMDGRVSIDDVTDLIDILFGSVLTVYDMGAADLDRDGKITIADLTLLIDRILKGSN